MSFAALKKRRGSDIQDLAKRVKEQESSQPPSGGCELKRMWFACFGFWLHPAAFGRL